MNIRSILASCAIAASLIGFSGAAHADCSPGFLTNALCSVGVINKGTANAVDDWHAANGRPLDHIANQAAGAAVNYVAPGAGTYVTEGLELRDQYNRGAFGGQQNPGMGGPQPYVNNGPAYPQQVGYTQPVQLGNVCVTQFGNFPGPFNPIGSFCQVPTPNGIIVGRVLM